MNPSPVSDTQAREAIRMLATVLDNIEKTDGHNLRCVDRAFSPPHPVPPVVAKSKRVDAMDNPPDMPHGPDVDFLLGLANAALSPLDATQRMRVREAADALHWLRREFAAIQSPSPPSPAIEQDRLRAQHGWPIDLRTLMGRRITVAHLSDDKPIPGTVIEAGDFSVRLDAGISCAVSHWKLLSIDPLPEPLPPEKGTEKVLEWPSDLSTLVGKVVALRMKHRDYPPFSGTIRLVEDESFWLVGDVLGRWFDNFDLLSISDPQETDAKKSLHVEPTLKGNGGNLSESPEPKPVPSGEKPKRSRPYPWPCAMCGKREVFPGTIPWDSDVKLDDRLWRVKLPAVPAHVCSCGSVTMDTDADTVIRGRAKELSDMASLSADLERVKEAARRAADQLKRGEWNSHNSGTWTILDDALKSPSPGAGA